MQAVILAGGKGSRLRPFTTNIPKPLVPIDDQPILNVILKQLKYHGATDVTLAVNHLAELFMAFFKDGKKFGLNIDYSFEEIPLGTAGPLAIVDKLDDNFIVMNGDLLTTINYKKMFDFHIDNNCDVTIATYQRDVKIDLGVLDIKDEDFINYTEKPVYHYTVSTGIYVINKKVIEHIPKYEKYDLPDFVMKLKELGYTIKAFQDDFYWLDIGRVDDYEQACDIFKEKKESFLPHE